MSLNGYLFLPSDVTFGQFEALQQQVNRIEKAQQIDKSIDSSKGTHNTTKGSGKPFLPGFKN